MRSMMRVMLGQAAGGGGSDIATLVALLLSRSSGITAWLGGVDRRYGMTLDGSGNISDWADAYTGSALLTQSSATKRPAGSTLNGGVFDGTDDYLTSPAVSGFALDTPKTMLVVLELPTSASDRYAASLSSDDELHFFRLRKKSNKFGCDFNPSGPAGGFDNGDAAGTTRRAVILRHDFTAGTIQVYGNTQTLASGSAPTLGTGKLTRFVLGAGEGVSGTFPAAATIAAAFVFDGASTTTEDADLFAWAVAYHSAVAVP